MSVHKDLRVSYHQQDTDYYCGAACAQMVLDEAGNGLMDQTSLYNDNHNHSTTEPGWATGPDGLTWTLNHRQIFSNKYFVLDALGAEDSISRMLAWTIHHYKIAPVALVYGWAHWIVIRGYSASASPASSIDTSYSIGSFDVNNPWPPVPPGGNPPPHHHRDGCGTGGNRGIANEHISYGTWQSTYMTGVPSGYWAGKYVAVCDPDPPPAGSAGNVVQPKLLAGDRIVTAQEAITLAEAGLSEYGLHEREIWRDSLSGTTAGEPVLVQRLDRTDEFYYLVPMQRGTQAPGTYVAVDARFGNYMQAVTVPGQPALEIDRQAAAEQLLQQGVVDVTNERNPIVIRPEAFAQYPALVWKPCRESLSPFYPFHMFTVGSRQIYVRVDGAVFTELHVDGRGL
jgi:hypothetical protein